MNNRAPDTSKLTDQQLPTWLIFSALFTFRVLNVLGNQTFFQPDESFQALEPAWQLVSGSEGGAWITWEWRNQLRSATHPVLFSIVYRIASQISRVFDLSRSSEAELLLAAPKILQAAIAACLDLSTWRLARRIYGNDNRASLAALALTVLSPWQWFCSVRTFSNTLETALTIFALEQWPWEWSNTNISTSGSISNPSTADKKFESSGTAEDLRRFFEGAGTSPVQRAKVRSSTVAPADATKRLSTALTAAAFACILRPTNVIIWATIAITVLWRWGDYSRLVTLTRVAVLSGSSVLVVSSAIDRSYYGFWTLPPVRFIYFNLVQSLAVFYGRNRADYYFTEGIPLLLTTALPFAILGLWQALRPGVDRPQFRGYLERQTLFVLAAVVVATVLAFSCIAHKEVRFMYPLLPVLHVLAAKPLASFFRPFPLPASKVRLAALLLGLTVNVYIAAYVSLVHQRGVLDVMHYLRHEAEIEASTEDHLGPSVRNTTVGFFMPCHSTPWRSHFVYPEISAWALTCEPPVNMTPEERQTYVDEADVFYAHPGAWIDKNMEDRRSVLAGSVAVKHTQQSSDERRPWPEYLVFFQHLEPVMNAVLENSKYEECWRGFNTHWHDDGRRQGDVIVWCIR